MLIEQLGGVVSSWFYLVKVEVAAFRAEKIILIPSGHLGETYFARNLICSYKRFESLATIW